jgi:hypothetical protein
MQCDYPIAGKVLPGQQNQVDGNREFLPLVLSRVRHGL